MNTTTGPQHRAAHTRTLTPGVSADVAAANAAYIATLNLPPLTAGQASRIRAIAQESYERRQAASAARPAA